MARRKFRKFLRPAFTSGGLSFRQFLQFYNRNIAITRTIDAAISKGNPAWSNLSRDHRYQIIHRTLGVDAPISFFRGLEDGTRI